MCKKHKDKHIDIRAHLYPPFPSFAWVMTAQENPPTQGHAYGFIRNAQSLHPRPRANRGTCPGRHRSYMSPPRSSPSPARAMIDPCNEKFMETVDYRYHDGPPSRPYVPWLEGYILRERDASGPQLRYQQQLNEGSPPPGLTTIETPAIAQTPSAVTATFSKCVVSGGYDDVRPKRRVMVDVVRLNRLDVALNALRRACGFSDRRPSKSSKLT